MKTTTAALTCSLLLAACADNPPARDPSLASTDVQPMAMQAPPKRETSMPSSASASRMSASQETSTPATPDTTQVPANPPANAPAMGVTSTQATGELTPMDQGNSDAETQVTASIRKGLMGDSSLSFTAKNVKIITIGTKVTLRGPVRSAQERTTIENLARQTAGVTEVDDQLEVKK